MRRHVAVLLMVWAASAAGVGAEPPALGHVEFEATGAPEARDAFLEGVLWLHSFEYEDAREAFQEALRIDPDFVMAYWGEAMTHNHPIWLRQDREAGLAALEQLGETPQARAARASTVRERDYLAALEVLYGEGDKLERDLAYAETMRRLAERYPGDPEAAAFYALSLLGTCHDGRDFATYMKAAAVVEEVFARNPRHPGAAHYLIHSYDEAVHAPLGLRAARVYAQIAPSAPHAQHMPSHIFLALGMWDDTVAANERSWGSSEERMRRKGLGKDARGYHALDWLAYGYLQQGRFEDAEELLRLIDEDARETGSRRTRWYLTSMRAMHVVERRTWDSEPLGVETGDLGAATTAADLFARGYSALKLGRPDEARRLHAQLVAERERRVGEAEAGCHASGTDDVDNLPSLLAAEVIDLELSGLLELHDGRVEAGLDTLSRAATLEDSIPSEFGPPAIVKPSHELLGEALLAQGRAADALAQFEITLRHAPGRSQALLGQLRAAAKLGRVDLVDESYARLRVNWAGADTPPPDLKRLSESVAALFSP